MRYRREIDGLRAFAIIPVVLHHLGVASLPGGYLGVDVFFVISGFLITSLLQRELKAGTFSIGRFWQRRVRRLFPAAWVMVAVSACVMHFTHFIPDLVEVFPEQRAALLGYANIHFWSLPTGGNYWTMQSEFPPYLHFWSLAIEEQFYLLFPPALWVIWRFAHRWRVTVIGSSVAISFAVFWWGLDRFPTAIFFLLPGRAWELGLGCWLALWSVRSPRNASVGVSLSTIGLITIGQMYFLPSEAGVLGPTAIGAVVGAALIIAGGSNPVSRRLLENPLMVYVGKISYSLYLWHWVVITFFLEIPQLADIEFGMVWGTLIFVPLSIASYHWVEKPTRSHPSPWSAWGWIGAHALCSLGYFLLRTATLQTMRQKYLIGQYPTNSTTSPPLIP
jgi:peptidoglycan/LPS O-acetylase OafA/YrhL